MEDLSAEFRRRHTRWFGKENPSVMNEPFWLDQIERGWSAAEAVRDGGISVEEDQYEGGPVWSFDRFGQARVKLRDGRVLAIGGEHEDGYDPDFCIYNDVVVFEPGGRVTVLGYPREVFRPTDFATATEVGEGAGGGVYVIGRLGYREERVTSETPVYRMELGTMKMEQVEVAGEGPKGLHRHFARWNEVEGRIELWGGVVMEPVERGVREFPLNREKWGLAVGKKRCEWVRLGEAAPLVPREEFPWPWEKVSEREAVSRAVSLGREVPPGHELFGCAGWAIAHVDVGTTAFELVDGRVAVVELDFCQRQELPGPRFQMVGSVGAFLKRYREMGRWEGF